MPTRKDDSGRWHVEVCVDRRRLHRRLPPGATASDAKHLEAELIRSLRLQRTARAPVIPGDPMLAEILGAYTEQHAEHLRSPETARHHAYRIGRWVEGKRASEAKAVAAAIVKDMRGHYKPATINRSLGALKKALSLAHDLGRTPVNYGADIKRLPENNARDTFLTLDQVQTIAQHCSEQVQATIWLAVLAGLRRGEILALRREDIMGDTLLIRAGNTKTLRTRSVPIVPALRPWLAHVPLQITFEGVKSAWQRARVKAGLPEANFHDLRHSCASLLLQVPGVTLYTVGEILGHTSTQTTKRYAHLVDDQKRKALEGLGAVFTAGLHRTA
jgi:integrase